MNRLASQPTENKMTPIQKKAIEHAIKLLEEINNCDFWPENYADMDAAKAAAVKQRAEVSANGGKKREAIEWLKASLG